MIPKLIHYCWFGGKPLPRLAIRCMDSWRRMCPDYEIKRWDETNFDVRQHPFVRSAYEAAAWAFVSDWARLQIINEHGGIYLDTDIMLIKSLDSLLEHSCYLGVQQVARLCSTGLGFGAVKSSPVIQRMLEQYDCIDFSWEKKNEIACPILNDRVARDWGYVGDGNGDVVELDGLTVYPCRFLDPISPGDTDNLMCEETISMSLYSNSWGSLSERFRRSIICAYGVERVNRIKELLHGQR